MKCGRETGSKTECEAGAGTFDGKTCQISLIGRDEREAGVGTVEDRQEIESVSFRDELTECKPQAVPIGGSEGFKDGVSTLIGVVACGTSGIEIGSSTGCYGITVV